MNLKEDKDKILEMLTSEDLDQTQTAEWQLTFIRAGYNSEFIAENL